MKTNITMGFITGFVLGLSPLFFLGQIEDSIREEISEEVQKMIPNDSTTPPRTIIFSDKYPSGAMY